MKTYYSLREQWEWVKPIWRILLVVLIAQLFGGFVSIILAKYEHLFLDFWFGGAVSTLVGFVLGVLWQAYANRETIKDNFLVIAFIGVLSLALTLSAFFMPLEQFLAGQGL